MTFPTLKLWAVSIKNSYLHVRHHRCTCTVPTLGFIPLPKCFGTWVLRIMSGFGMTPKQGKIPQLQGLYTDKFDEFTEARSYTSFRVRMGPGNPGKLWENF